jgi:hypothetical protein
LDTRLTTLLCKKKVVAKSRNGLIQEKSGRTFYGRLWLKKGCFASDDDDQ